MEEKIDKMIEITDLKDMLKKTKSMYANEIAYKIKDKEGNYQNITHKEVRDNIDALGTALIEMGLKGKRIAVIGENRYEWEMAYLAIVCGVGVVVPLDKALPENELISLIERSKVEAIFYSNRYETILKKIKEKQIGNLKQYISMDLEDNTKDAYSERALIELGKTQIQKGDTRFLDATIYPKEMSILLFTSGTTSASKVVALSHYNICSNLMDIASVLDVNEKDVFLSVLPVHHVFECTVGFLFALYKGATTVFSEGVKHMIENLKEHQVSVMACVPAIYERIYKIIRKELEKQGKLDDILQKEEQYKNATMEEKKVVFQEIHNMLGGNLKVLISGAAALNRDTEAAYRNLGLPILQGYGLTETSPVVAIGGKNAYRLGSVGKAVPHIQAKIKNPSKDGIGELVVKGPNIMLGYFENKEATKEVLQDGWFATGDLAKIDEDGYIYICGRKKSVIVLKNGKNIFPEEMENLINQIEGVKESFVFGKQVSEDKEDIKVYTKIVWDREVIKQTYHFTEEQQIQSFFSQKVKEINQTMPRYKAIKKVILTEEPLLKTTTNKIKRQANLDEIEQFEYKMLGKECNPSFPNRFYTV